MNENKNYSVECYEFLYNNYDPTLFQIGDVDSIKEALLLISDFIDQDFEQEILTEGERRDRSKPKPVYLHPLCYDFTIHEVRQMNMDKGLFSPGALVFISPDIVEESYYKSNNKLTISDLKPDFDPEISMIRVFVVKNNQAAFLSPTKED